MHTSFARTSQMLTSTYLGFATHNTCTRIHARKKTRAHICTCVFKSRAAERLESPLCRRNKSRASERSKLFYAGFP